MSGGPALPPTILILEDDEERVTRFRAAAARIAPPSPLVIWRDAGRMIRELPPHLDGPCLLSLDHDLEPEAPGDDTGDGIDVVRWLVARPARHPIIIHSSNRERSSWMAGDLELAGWGWWSVYPLGDDWIEVDWAKLARRLLRRLAR